jgi:hypothetical protein
MTNCDESDQKLVPISLQVDCAAFTRAPPLWYSCRPSCNEELPTVRGRRFERLLNRLAMDASARAALVRWPAPRSPAALSRDSTSRMRPVVHSSHCTLPSGPRAGGCGAVIGRSARRRGGCAT